MHPAVLLMSLATTPPGAEDGLPGASAPYAVTATGATNGVVWWQHFADPALTRAIETGFDGNYDIKTAAARVVQAEASSLRALSPLLPQLTADATAQAAPFDSLGFQFGGGIGSAPDSEPPAVFYNGSALLNARWQLDIWGRSYLAYRAATLEQRASEGDQASVALALAIQIGAAYFDIVLAKQSIAVVTEQIAVNRRLLDLLEFRFERGQSTGLDVLQQKQQYAARAAELPPLRAQLRVAEQRLLILLGRPPSSRPIKTADRLATPPPSPALGKPADLLTNRPDLRAAIDRLESSAERADQSIESFLPSLSINGNAGWQFFRATETNELFVWGAGVTLSIPLFDGLNNVGQVREARAQMLQLKRALSQSFLQAVQEVESARVTEKETSEQLTLLREQETAARAALRESEARYISGLADYLTVLTALNAQQGVQRAVLQAQRSLLDARLQLHQALAGPWTKDLGAGQFGDQ